MTRSGEEREADSHRGWHRAKPAYEYPTNGYTCKDCSRCDANGNVYTCSLTGKRVIVTGPKAGICGQFNALPVYIPGVHYRDPECEYHGRSME